jgi:uncharacterized protein
VRRLAVDASALAAGGARAWGRLTADARAWMKTRAGVSTALSRRTGRTTVYFALVGVCSLPFWFAGAVTDLTITSTLSVASLMIVAPSIAAIVLTRRDLGRPGVRQLLGRVIHPRLRGGPRWYLPVVVLPPAAVAIEVALLRLAGRDVPAFEVSPLVLVADLAVFWLAATLEEVGWTGYATDRLRVRRSALTTGLAIGMVWALWHIPAMLAMTTSPTWSWIAFQCANLVGIRILMVWLYDATGRSLFAMIAFHAVFNVSTMTLFPVYGSHYDPYVASLVVWLAVGLVLARRLFVARTRFAPATGRAVAGTQDLGQWLQLGIAGERPARPPIRVPRSDPPRPARAAPPASPRAAHPPQPTR